METANGTQLEEKCRHCNSSNLEYSKTVGQGKKVTQFHYKIRCLDCKKNYHVPRTRFIFEKVKDLPWILSKNARKLRSRRGTARSD